MEIVLQRSAMDVGEDARRDERQCEQDRHRNDCSSSEDRESGTHHLADPLALAAAVGVGDKTGHARLQAEIGDAEKAGGE